MDKKIYLYIVILICFIFIIENIYNTPNIYQNIPNTDYKIINTIPNNVFLTFSTLDLPYKMNENLEINKQNNLEFNFYVYIYIYDDKMAYIFIKNNFDNSIANIFRKIRPGAYKADLLRYCLLYTYGGVYMDIKWRLNVKLLDLINKYCEVYVKDPDWDPTSCKRGCNNGFMISKLRNPIFLDCINQIKKNYDNNYYGRNFLYPTGPCLLGYIIRSKYNDIKYELTVSKDKSPYTIDDMDGNVIVFSYSNYRDELSRYSKNKHYSSMWYEKDIYDK
jgi:mannosyltransferase OCH1-like enzyme